MAAHLVVLDVVLLEHHGEGDADREVGKDGEEAVLAHAAEGEVVRDLVHGEERVLVGRAADEVGEGPELEREEGCRAQVPRRRELDEGDEEDDVFGEGLVTHELGDLRAREERVSTCGTRASCTRLVSESDKGGGDAPRGGPS